MRVVSGESYFINKNEELPEYFKEELDELSVTYVEFEKVHAELYRNALIGMTYIGDHESLSSDFNTVQRYLETGRGGPTIELYAKCLEDMKKCRDAGYLEIPIFTISDDDLVAIGKDPATVSDEFMELLAVVHVNERISDAEIDTYDLGCNVTESTKRLIKKQNAEAAKKSREAVLLSMNDEDLESAGVDPKAISESSFNRIAEIARDMINENFMDMLKTAIQEEAQERKDA